MDQPTPTVSRADVERVARRDFTAKLLPAVMAALDKYVALEPHRVQLAVMKLANGDIKELNRYVQIANDDWRDVLGPAEYPLSMKNMFRHDELSRIEIEKIYEADWQQYIRWLNK